MRVSTARALTIAFFCAYAVAVTWPAAVLTNRVRPLVFGLPFNMFWPALWVVLGGVALWLLDRVERRARSED